MPSLMEPSCLHCPSYGSSFHAVIRRQEEWLASRRASGRIDQCSRTPIRSSILLKFDKPHRVFQPPRKSSRATLHVYVIAGAHQALGTKAWRRPIRPTMRNPAQSQRKRPHGFPRGQRGFNADPVSLDRGQPNCLGNAASLVGADEAVQGHRWKTSAGVRRVEQTDFAPCRQARHQSNPQRDRIGRGDADGRDDGAIGDPRPTQPRRQVAAERARNVPDERQCASAIRHSAPSAAPTAAARWAGRRGRFRSRAEGRSTQPLETNPAGRRHRPRGAPLPRRPILQPWRLHQRWRPTGSGSGWPVACAWGGGGGGGGKAG